MQFYNMDARGRRQSAWWSVIWKWRAGGIYSGARALRPLWLVKPFLLSFLLSADRGCVGEKRMEIGRATGSLFFKCGCCLFGAPLAALLHLNDHGGKEVEKGKAMAVGVV
jgi:hypothetical protein